MVRWRLINLVIWLLGGKGMNLGESLIKSDLIYYNQHKQVEFILTLARFIIFFCFWFDWFFPK